MPDVLFNDASLEGQFAHSAEFDSSFSRVMAMRNSLNKAAIALKIGGTLGQRKVTATHTFQDWVYALPKDRKQQVARWMTKDGPFWDIPAQISDGEMLFLEEGEQSVGGTALAEAACLVALGSEVWLISIDPSHFTRSPIQVIWPQSNAEPISVGLENFWRADELQTRLSLLPVLVTSWDQLLNIIGQTDGSRNIVWQDQAEHEMKSWLATSQQIVNRIVELLLGILANPFIGIGKPEPLKYDYAGAWSRRIDGANRLIYIVEESVITILTVKGHYD
jgi:toxin YoeB